MAHYAKVNGLTKKVEKVIRCDEAFIESLPDKDFWIQTSYNTYGGKHYTEDEEGVRTESVDQTKALRKNYAGVGFTYDADRDAFIPPKPFASWTLNETTCIWEAPIAKPSGDALYRWDEDAYQADNTTGWEEVTDA